MGRVTKADKLVMIHNSKVAAIIGSEDHSIDDVRSVYDDQREPWN